MRKTFRRCLLLFIMTVFTTFSPGRELTGLGVASADTACPAPLCQKPYVKDGVAAMNVMAPLCMDDIMKDGKCGNTTDSFKKQLKTAKAMGVRAVSVDIWWGLVEKDGDNRFNWDYYDKVVDAIKTAGLHWAPILSFHQCGGNVGDECDIPIPGWIWNRYKDKKIPPEDLKYESEKGNMSVETVSLWMDDVVMDQYVEFMREFVSHFGNRPGVPEMTDEINISMGPAGELRYPSYNSHDSWRYPGRGFFQAYSKPAREDFRRYVLARYGTLAKVNRAWNASLKDAGQIGPPEDNPLSIGRAESFINRGDYKGTQYGRDFIDWYSSSLVEHGRNMLQISSKALGGPFAKKEISLKTAGIHWQMCGNAPQPRIAEITAGLIRTSGDYNSASTGHGYHELMEMIAASGRNRKVSIYFTCLEMDNSSCGSNSPDYSLAKALVFWVAQAAETACVTIKGENALSEGVKNDTGWNNIENAFCYAPYSGLTVLRINDVTENATGKNRYKCLIDRFAGAAAR